MSTLISRCSSPMPLRMVWPLSWSVETRKDGSSWARRTSAMPIFSWSALVLGSMATSMTGSGNSIFSRITGLFGSHSVSPVVEYFSPAKATMSPAGFLDVLAAVGVHQQHAADALGLVLHRIQGACARSDHAGIDAHEGDGADKRVVHDLEGETGEGRLVVGGTGDFITLGIDAHQGRNVERAGEIVDYGIQQGLNALVLEGGAAHHRHKVKAVGALADAALEIGFRRLGAFEIGSHEIVVFFDRHFDQGGAQFLRLVGIFGGNFDFVELRAQLLVMPDQRLHPDDIDDALEFRFHTDRPGDDHRAVAQPVDHHVYAALKIRAGAIHLVDEADARHVILVGLAPHGFGLGLHAGDGVEHGDSAVQHAHGALDFNGEVDMTGRVDDVDPVFFPVAGRRGRRDGDVALLFLFHEIHGGGAVMDFANLMRLAGVIENALSRRRLAGIDMRGNADVAIHAERGGAGHFVSSYQR